MNLRLFAAAVALLTISASAAHADEGMWTFDNFPAAKVKAAYGVDITPAWLARVQAASVRLSIGCSGSVVSGQGLILTNNHCVADCAHDISPPGQDDFKTGYQAQTPAEEKTCPGMRADILVGVTDVTARMSAAGAGLTGEPLVKARGAAAGAITAEACGADRKLHCEVVNLYRGGQFKLYRYRAYTDVRLVFSAGDLAASFGGDPDNFNFPRYALDAAFLRLYEDGRPVATPDHLRFNPAPPTNGEAAFVSGNPGSTFRQFTVSQLETQRDLVLPAVMSQLSELRGRLIRFVEESPENARTGGDELMGIENDYKAFVGRLSALDDARFMAERRAAEADLRSQAIARMGPGFGDPWADIAAAQARVPALFMPSHMVDGGPWDSTLFDDARTLVRVGVERARAPAERLPEYAESELPALEQRVLDPTPIEPAMEQLQLEFWLSKSREYLTADDPNTKILLGNESPEGLSARLVSATKLADPAVRKALWDGGLPAVQASTDPLIRYVIRTDGAARSAREAYEDQIVGPTARAAEAIARARFALYGTSVYPDATFTLRLSYGRVAGWDWRGKTIAPFTTFAGLYARATGAAPFDLDPRWVAAKDKLNPDTVFDLVTTNDITGGNSGSPLLNAKGEVIGTVFDGNIQSLGGDYGYDPAVNRSVAVSAAAIAEALTKVYNDQALAKELSGS